VGSLEEARNLNGFAPSLFPLPRPANKSEQFARARGKPTGGVARLERLDSDDRQWLRTRRHRIVIARTDDGRLALEFDDYEVYDACEDFLTEECDLGDDLSIDGAKRDIPRILILDLTITEVALAALLDKV
jgi:hypothetical protein